MADRRRIWPYDVRYYPAPVPSAGVFDEPKICIKINEVWALQVDSVVERLLRADAWQGTEEERQAGVDAANLVSQLLNKGGECMACSDESFEIIDGHLWRTCQDDEPEDLGQVVGEQGMPGDPGSPGADGLPGSTGAAGSAGADGADGVDGADGSDGANGDVESPGPNPGEASAGLKCAVSVNLTKYLRGRWSAFYGSDIQDAQESVAAAAIPAVGIFVLLFPGFAAVATAAAVIYSIAVEIGERINEAEANNFDDEAEERFRCFLYCILGNDGVISPEIISDWSDAIRADGDMDSTYAGLIADFLATVPFAAMEWVAFTSSAINPDACDCDDCPPEWESVLDFTTDDYSEIITVVSGTYDGANGYVGVPASGQFYTVNLQIDFTSATLTFMEMQYSAGGGSGGSAGVAFYVNGPSWAGYGSVGAVGSGSNLTHSRTVNATTANGLLSIGTGTTNAPCYAEKWTLRGTGTKPSELP